jgi:hypothetical protein
VEVHGVRAVFKKGAPHIVENSRTTSKPGMPASRQHVEPASAPTAKPPRPPNSDKRRSARRMQEYIKEMQGARSKQTTTQPKLAEPVTKLSAPVDSDVRMSDASPGEAVKGASWEEAGGHRVEGARTQSCSCSICQAVAAATAAATEAASRRDDGEVGDSCR